VPRTRQTAPPELDRLELGVRRLIDANAELRRRAEAAEAAVADLHSAVQGLAAGTLDPLALSARVETLEAENRELRDRLAQARQAVQRMLGRLHFVEEER
jgi:predicted RNase H-like nuclease (RuvC/YqgF family)